MPPKRKPAADQLDDDLDDLDDLDDAEGDDDADTNDDGARESAGGAADGAGVLEAIHALGAKLDGLTGGAADDDEGEPVKAGSAREREVDVEGQVRRALARVGRERDLDERVQKVEKAVERPPVKQGRLSRALWGRVDA